ncbi:DUF1573 domain-containing protein [Candidatus Poribacteria bacterium]|nr:DUF1573 domain-containing protein [Candidatus Poribacteria bacterium]
MEFKSLKAFICLFLLFVVTFVYALDAPKIVISESVWDIGTVDLGEEIRHVFKIKNKGSEELIITQLRSSCSCLKVEITSDTIQPDEESDIKAVFKEDERLGEVVKTIYIDSNDPENPRSIIRVKAEVSGKDVSNFQDTKPSAESISHTDAKVQKTEDGSVCFIMFYSEDCNDCIYVKNELIPVLNEKFSEQLSYKFLSVEDVDNYDLLVSMEEYFGDEGNDIPVIFIGRNVLGGKEEIVNNLGKLVAEYSEQGGCDFPGIAEINTKKTEKTSEKTIYIAYFEKPGCKECNRVNYILKSLKRSYPEIQIKRFNSEKKEDIELFEAICCLYKVPKEERLIAPAVFIGEKHLYSDEITDKKLKETVKKYQEIGTTKPWEDAEEIRSSARNNLIERFKTLGPFAILVAGLLDGVNPCAFATIIMFMSYLALVGRKGKDLIYVGTAFTVAVFLTYFLIGLGVFSFIQTLSVFSIFSRILYIIIILLTFVLAVLSLYDFIMVKRGKSQKMFLQLPGFLKDRINKTIRGKMRTKRFIIASFVAGVIVSLMELACTGQVYLPTLCFVVGVPELRRNAILYLLLYNFMFIIPLIVIFILTYLGTSFTSLTKVFQRHLALLKLLTSILFFGLCAFLISTLI